jgi:hypothetical protein
MKRFFEDCHSFKLETLMDLLEYYNTLDVEPFLEALQIQRETFYQYDIDIFKDFFTVSSIAKHMLCKFSEKHYVYKEPKTSDKPLNYSKIDMKIRNYLDRDRKCKLRNDGLTNDNVIDIIKKYKEKCFYCEKMLDDDWTLDRLNNNIGHQANNCVLCCEGCNTARGLKPYWDFMEKKKEQRLDEDYVICIIDNQIVVNKIKSNIVGGPSIVFSRYHKVGETEIRKPRYINGKWIVPPNGKKVFKILGYDANALYLYCLMQYQLCGKLKYVESDDWDSIEDDVINDKFFGIVEVDIKVPTKLYNKFLEFSPIFINTEVPVNIEDDMENVRSERKLIGSLSAKRICLITPLLKWYLSHGLRVTKMYGHIKANPVKIFKEFGEWVADERRTGKIDEAYSTKAECAKLIGNSAYGATIMNKEKFLETTICDEADFKRKMYTPYLKDFNVIGDVFELSLKKKKIIQDTAIQVGFAVLQYAKLRMLEFYYDCLCKYLDDDDFQLMQMDTDSFYFAISEDGYNKLEMIEESERSKWFPTRNEGVRDFISEGRKYEMKKSVYENFTPGLFKLEKSGNEMVCLTSKTYILDNKSAAKGCQKSLNDLSIEKYKSALFDNESIMGVNRGFRLNNNVMQTYEQNKIILTNKYSKRPTLDNLFTRPYLPREIDAEVSQQDKVYNVIQKKSTINKVKETKHHLDFR